MTTRKKEWFDDESLWRELYKYMFGEERFSEAAGQIDQVLELTKPQGKSILDLCCGPGRFSIAFARRGYAVTGVDRTKYLLAKARARARTARVNIEWIQKDMRDFIRPDAYDLVLSMFTSFGYFDDKQEDLRVLQNMFASLRPGGKCILDVTGKEVLCRIFQPTTSDILDKDTRMIQCHEIFDDWTRIRNEWILIRKGKVLKWNFHHTIYSGQELRDRMETAGFVDVRLYGNFLGDEYGPQAQRLIAIGEKPALSKRTRR